jgi:hypothetical protein
LAVTFSTLLAAVVGRHTKKIDAEQQILIKEHERRAEVIDAIQIHLVAVYRTMDQLIRQTRESNRPDIIASKAQAERVIDAYKLYVDEHPNIFDTSFLAKLSGYKAHASTIVAFISFSLKATEHVTTDEQIEYISQIYADNALTTMYMLRRAIEAEFREMRGVRQRPRRVQHLLRR